MCGVKPVVTVPVYTCTLYRALAWGPAMDTHNTHTHTEPNLAQVGVIKIPVGNWCQTTTRLTQTPKLPTPSCLVRDKAGSMGYTEAGV